MDEQLELGIYHLRHAAMGGNSAAAAVLAYIESRPFRPIPSAPGRAPHDTARAVPPSGSAPDSTPIATPEARR